MVPSRSWQCWEGQMLLLLSQGRLCKGLEVMGVGVLEARKMPASEHACSTVEVLQWVRPPGIEPGTI